MYYNGVTEKLTPFFRKSIKTREVRKVRYIYMYQLEGTDTVKRIGPPTTSLQVIDLKKTQKHADPPGPESELTVSEALTHIGLLLFPNFMQLSSVKFLRISHGFRPFCPRALNFQPIAE